MPRGAEHRHPSALAVRAGCEPFRPFVEQAFEHATFFTPLYHFVLISDAYIVAPGGLGTLLETMMIWQLLQTRHLHDTALIFAGPMWRSLLNGLARRCCTPDSSWRAPST